MKKEARLADLLVMVPTRGRPANCARFAEAFQATVRGDTDLLWIVDHDDKSYDGRERLSPMLEAGRIFTWITKGRVPTLVEKLNGTAQQFADGYPVLMFTGDDTVPLTEGWDKLLLAAISDMGGTGWSYPEDNRRNDIPEHWAVSTDIVKTLGWFACPALKHFYIDNVTSTIGKAVGRIQHVPQAVLDHLHPTCRPEVPGDETYSIAAAHLPGDYARFLEWQAKGAAQDIAKVQAIL